ncbi:hypothetical protein VW29_17795 [Devosia limi DSM 17137]|uniref:Uncharacterized protein n=1 Tax=Devosia limi DSM 17137 TaxID=1121477 RepID=A0A0F5LAP3_9HYPH|nr:hypothetical protein VW29_17795 [Devosia limi DSM 17137]SHF32254.1 hypothetical protein SAMN02745223_02348 [Devosia limi DSM 17137]
MIAGEDEPLEIVNLVTRRTHPHEPILLENYVLRADLKAPISAFVENHDHQRYHTCLNDFTPVDAYFGAAADIIEQREGKGSNARLSSLGACSTARSPHNINSTTRLALR